MTYNEENGTVIYRSRMHAKTNRNFEIFSAEDFIAAITQHIPEKGFQMVRYYGWYSNRARGERTKKRTEGADLNNPAEVEVIDVSDYQPRRLPSKKWRELICGSEMRMVALIDDDEVIEKILRHLDLWPQEALPTRAPPMNQSRVGTVQGKPGPIIQDYIIEPVLDDLPSYDEVIAG